MADLDFANWVARAHAFTIELRHVPGATVRSSVVSPPSSESELVALERALGRSLPTGLRLFFAQGAAVLDCAYVFEPTGETLKQLATVLPTENRIFGGARLGPAPELADYSSAVRAWSADTWIADESAQREMWESAIPFLRLDNGDYLALDPRVDPIDPAVAYLCHDDESFLLAPQLAEFLIAWERLCYLGPEHWLLRPFIGEGGYLDTEPPLATRLRALLGR
jgi:hypothetical protein